MTETPENILQTYWGYDSFRPVQRDIVQSTLDGQDSLVILPTGGGKSICYQIPGLMLDGCCLVISPLIALMKDQVAQLNARGIHANAIFSGMRPREIDMILDNAAFGETKFLYVSPERLQTTALKGRLPHMNISMVAIDEAHCISQWGHEFRPSYRQIAALRDLLPHKVPFMALTASATPTVKDDIIDLLTLEGPTFTGSFVRKNLSFVTRSTDNKVNKTLQVIERTGGCGIIYVRSRKKTVQVAEMLQANHLKASHYHAGLSPELRDQRQREWMEGQMDIMVCTNAFGMGIDKSNVRYVIHWDVPDSLEAYYQEAGRAGRDGQLAYAVLLHSPTTLKRLSTTVNRQFPDITEIRRVYNALCNYFSIAVGSGFMQSHDFELIQFARKFRLEALQAFRILDMLETEGYLLISDSVRMPSRLKFAIGSKDIYRFQVGNDGFDRIIQALLRTYGGILDHYAMIHEKHLAVKMGKTIDEVKQQLVQLNQLKVVTYIPYKQNPTITILKDRVADASLIIDQEFWVKRKETAVEKVRAIISYCEDDDICKQIQIAGYFGESLEANCGICSSCMARKAGYGNRSEDIQKQIIDRLKKDGAVTLATLLDGAGHHKQDKVKQVVRNLLDDGKLILKGKEICLNS